MLGDSSITLRSPSRAARLRCGDTPSSESTFALIDRRDRSLVWLLCAWFVVEGLTASWWSVALGIWWLANTIAHQFVHRPFFRGRLLNRLVSAALSSGLLVPQELWRQRHLAHHAGTEWRLAWDPALAAETILVSASWTMLAVALPPAHSLEVASGWVLGMSLCWLHGHFEHVRGTTSCRVRWWNVLFLNDGYHTAHHLEPSRAFRDLPRVVVPSERLSRWPPILRWLDHLSLTGLERLVLRSPVLQRLVLDRHRRAIARVLRGLDHIDRVVIIGGGLFPRTAIVLRELLPDARIEVRDHDEEHVTIGAAFGVTPLIWRVQTYRPGERVDADLVVLPLALCGDRAAVYAHPPAPLTLVHDWLHRRRGASAVVAVCLWKRVNLLREPVAT